MELSNMKMDKKEKIKDFNVRFLALKNKIPQESMHAENLVIAYYVKALPSDVYIGKKSSKGNPARSI